MSLKKGTLIQRNPGESHAGVKATVLEASFRHSDGSRDYWVQREDLSSLSMWNDKYFHELAPRPLQDVVQNIEDIAVTKSRGGGLKFDGGKQLNDGARFPSNLPNGSEERKEYPVFSVLFGYFPAAMNALAHHAYKSNQKHNPGLPLQWSRDKSSDHEDCILRHLQEGDYEGVLWRAAALLQLKLEEEGAPKAPRAT